MPIDVATKVTVGFNGETVILLLGNTPLRMHYRDALWVSAEMRRLATIIKWTASPNGFKAIRSMGIMHDANAKTKPIPVVAGVPIHTKRRELKAKNLKLYSVGRKIMLQVGHHTAGFLYRDVFPIAQHLRMWAKQAMAKAGDTRHWSRVPMPSVKETCSR